jgi:hypothetical protein
MLKRVLVYVNDLTEAPRDDRPKPTETLKKLVIRGRSTRSQDLPKRNAGKSDKKDTSQLLAAYASTKTSKSALSLPPVSSLKNKNPSNPKPSLQGKEKLWKTIWELHIPTPLMARAGTMRRSRPSPNLIMWARQMRHTPKPIMALAGLMRRSPTPMIREMVWWMWHIPSTILAWTVPMRCSPTPIIRARVWLKS